MAATPDASKSSRRRARPAYLLLAATLAAAGSAGADWTYAPLEAGQIDELRAAIAEMKTNPRGPYLRIRWFCNDGSVLPPDPFACREHGGGHQHAELRPEIARFGDWGFHFGTIYQALDEAEFRDAANSGYRLRELVLHAYLEDVDHGWIMRRARYYRGARQAENEEASGRRLLESLLADAQWRRTHPLLATLLVDAVPHGTPGVPGARMRELATRIADRDAGFQPLRVKIHSTPDPRDLASVREYRERHEARLEADVAALLDELSAELESAYRVEIDAARWRSIAAALRGTPLEREAAMLVDRLTPADSRGRIAVLSAFLADARRALEADDTVGRMAGVRALAQLDAIRYAGSITFAEASRWLHERPRVTRAELLQVATQLIDAAYGTGWLSAREHDALRETAGTFLLDGDPTGAEYARTARYLAGAADWGLASLVQAFGPVLGRYRPVEPLVNRFPDDRVRGSILLPFANVMEELVADAAAALDMTHRVFDREVGSGVLALNPGLAVGRLHVLEDLTGVDDLDPEGIYVLPETPADLGRVAGIVTLEQGSRLSHVQLLARGLGIPNATVGSELLPALRAHEDDLVLYAVSRTGSVLLAPAATMPAAEADEAREWVDGGGTFEVDTARLDLGVRDVLPLTDVDVDDSGRIVGPKAANLGRLHGLFPDRVSPGLVIPFGVFHAHIDRDLDGDGVTLRQEIADIFRDERDALAAGEDSQAVRERVLARLDVVRARIRTMPLLPEFRDELQRDMRTAFGAPGTYGVFVRSDTNVEDLPNFSGAGLNLTVMNVIGTDPVLQAIRDVWASPFTQRSYLWRQRLIRNAEAVYPSIVLLQSVSSEASGVLVTDDVVGVDLGDAPGAGEVWTVTLAQGVGGVVDGEAAETVLLPAQPAADHLPVLVSSARAIWQKRLVTTGAGGIVEVPVGGDETLLTPARATDLRSVIREILDRYPRPRGETGAPQPWDIEFGFVGNRTILFQIRPFVTGSERSTVAAVEALDRRVIDASRRRVDLTRSLVLESDD